MATFNGARFIAHQLDSLASQELLPSELVVCDDGSDDETLAILDKFSSTAPFGVRIIKNPSRLGYRRNFIKAASLCSSQFIAFCDQDDIWYPEKLSTIMPEFRNDVFMVHHNASIYMNGQDVGRLKKNPPQHISCNLAIDPWWTSYGFTMIFQRKILTYFDLWEKSLCAHVAEDRIADKLNESHDHWVLFLSSALGKTVYIDKNLVRYRQHDMNAEGWGGAISITRRLRHQFERREKVYLLCYKSAKRRSKILKSIAEDSDPVVALSASRAYAELSYLYKIKYYIYKERDLAKRWRNFIRLIHLGAYNGKLQWSWGMKGFIKDLFLGAIFGGLLGRYGWPPAGSDPSCKSTSMRSR